MIKISNSTRTTKLAVEIPIESDKLVKDDVEGVEAMVAVSMTIAIATLATNTHLPMSIAEESKSLCCASIHSHTNA